MHQCIEEATIVYQRWNQAIVPYFNSIFVRGWKQFIQKEGLDLIIGANNATSAFAKTGLYPFNPLSESWQEAIKSLGFDKALDMRQEVTTKWEVKIITSEEGRVLLSDNKEKNYVLGGLSLTMIKKFRRVKHQTTSFSLRR